MPALLTEHGLLSLFLLSFCASTLVPLGSEWLLVALLLQGAEATSVVLVATLGNSLGGASSYLLGWIGSDWLTEKLLRITPARRARAERSFAHYGSWSLLFTWLPVVGDPLCLVAGVLKIHFGRFSLLVAGGKGLRYMVVAWLTLHGAALVS